MKGVARRYLAGEVHGTNHFRVYLLEVICSLNLTCRVSVRLSQSLPALSEHSVFLYVSHVCIALNIQHIMQNTWGNYGIFYEKCYF